MARLANDIVAKGPELTVAERIGLIVTELGGPVRAGELVDVTRQTVANWVSGKTAMSLVDALILAQATGVTLDWVATGHLHRPDISLSLGDGSEFALIFFWGIGRTGELSAVADPNQSVVAFRTSWLEQLSIRSEDAAFVQNHDDAMRPTIREGNLLLIDRSQNRINGDGIYVLARSGGFSVRRAQVLHDGSVMLLADYERYHPEKIDAGQVDAIPVAGRVRLGIEIY